MPRSKNHIAIAVFAKLPVLGTVKTRLEPRLTKENCLQLHQILLQVSIEKILDLDIRGLAKFLFLTGTGAEARRAATELGVPTDFRIEIQEGNSLGERLANALACLMELGCNKVIFLGADTPLLRVDQIHSAIEALSHHAVVISPATDGGYCLIGFSSRLPQVLEGIDWGSRRVYQQTVEHLQRLGVSWAALEEGFDIDTIEDLHRLYALLKADVSALSDNIGDRLRQFVQEVILHEDATRGGHR